MGSRRHPVRKRAVLCNAHGIKPACDGILDLQVGTVGVAHGRCCSHQLSGAFTHPAGQRGTLATGLPGARVDPEKEHRLCTDTRDGHRAFSTALAGVGEGIGDEGHLFQCDGDGCPGEG